MISSLIGCVFILIYSIIVDSVRTTHLPQRVYVTRWVQGLQKLFPRILWQVPKEPEETDGPEPDKAHREGAAG